MASFEEIRVDDDQQARRMGLPPGVVPALFGLVGVLVAGAVPYLWHAEDCVSFGEESLQEQVVEPGQELTGGTKFCAGDLQVWIAGDPPPFSQHYKTGTTQVKAKEEAQHTDQERGEQAEHSRLEQGTRTRAKLMLPSPTPTVDASKMEATESKPPAKPTFAMIAKAIDLPKDWYNDCTSDGSDCAPPSTLITGVSPGMDAFYRSLALTAIDSLQGKAKGHITRVAHWGDSAIVADGMTSAIRRLLQDSFGDAGHGFVLVDGGKSYAHQDVRHKAGTWNLVRIINRQDKLKRYGFGGIAAKGYGGAWASFGTVEDSPVGSKVSRFEVYHMKGPKKGAISLSVDGAEPILVDTAAESVTDGVFSLKVSDGAHRLKLRAKGPVRLYGVALERDAPGVVYDSLGLLGARGSRLLDYDDDHLALQFKQRDVKLFILMFGGNALKDRTSLETYRATFASLVKKFRKASPDSSCLIMSPVDHAELYRKRYRTVPRLLQIMPIQREVALQEGCAYFSNFDAMGGEGSMEAWVKRKPPLAYADYAHLRPKGGNSLGLRVFKALVYGFAEYVDSL
jgi:hypothetical protein